jgi:Dolichyl-phosphate-mannose-protein mannosyltransferase
MKSWTDPSKLEIGLRGLQIAAAAYFLLVFLGIALLRMSYPFELEGLEGGTLAEVQQILSGKPLYAPPTLEYTPFLYTPLYFYVTALPAALIGPGFLPLRLVSTIAALGTLALIFGFVRARTSSAFSGFLSAALFAATFRLGGAWFDLARVDSLFLFLTLAGAVLLSASRSVSKGAAAGLLLALAFLTKQTALLIALSFGLLILLPGRRKAGAAFFLVLAGAVGGSTVLMNALSSGWYRFYTFQLFGQHDLVRSQLLEYWVADILRPMGIAFALTLLHLYVLAVARKWDDFGFHVLFLAGMLGGSWTSRLHWGGDANVLVPAYAALAIGFGMGAGELLRPRQGGEASERPFLPRVPFYALCLIQFASLIYNPFNQIPSHSDREAGERLVRRLAAIRGEVLVPAHGYLGEMAGKKGSAQTMAFADALGGPRAEVSARLESEMRSALGTGRYQAILLDNRDREGPAAWRFIDLLADRYVYAGSVFGNGEVFYARTGGKYLPQELYLRRDDSP